jgi:hypothetical protein
MFYEGADKIDVFCTVLLQIEDKLGQEEVGKRLEDGSCFLVYLLDRSFAFYYTGVVRYCRSKNTHWPRETGDDMEVRIVNLANCILRILSSDRCCGR